MLAFFALAFVAILALALNLYLSLDLAAPRLHTFASGVAEVPLHFQTTNINVLKGAHLTHLQVFNPTSTAEPILLTAPDTTITYAPLALFQHRLLVRQLLFQKPLLAFAQDTSGDIPLPALAIPQTETEGNLPLEIKSLNIENGTVRVTGPTGTHLLQLEGLDHGGRLERNGPSVKGGGQFTAHTLTLGHLHISDIDTSYTFENGLLKISKLIGNSYHGQWIATLQIDSATDGMPCDFQLQANTLDLNELLKSVASKPDLLSGTLSLTASGRGSAGALTGITAQGNFDIRNGQLIHIDFIQDLAQAISIKELSQPDFSQAHGDFTIGQSTITLTTFTLTAPQFTLTGNGTITYDGTLNLNLTITFPPDFAKLLPKPLLTKLTTNPDNSHSIPFTLTGPIDHPISNLLSQLSFINLPAEKPATPAAPPATPPTP